MFENGPLADLVVGRSAVRQRILALLMTEPGVRLHLREIQRRAATSPGTASRELARLVSAGLIERQAEGNQVYFRGSTSPLAATLRSLLTTAPTLPPGPGVAPAARIEAARPPRGPETPPRPGGVAAVVKVGVAEKAAAEPAALTARAPRVTRSQITMPWAEAVVIARATPEDVRADPLPLQAGATAATRLRSIYGDRLRGIYLYGPRASAGAAPDSDVDLLVVLDRVERYGDELERTSAACASLTLELGIVVSRVFVSEADWRDRTDGQLPDVRAAAVAL